MTADVVRRCLFPDEDDKDAQEQFSVLVAEALVNLRQLTLVTRLTNVDPDDRGSVVMPLHAFTRA